VRASDAIIGTLAAAAVLAFMYFGVPALVRHGIL